MTVYRPTPDVLAETLDDRAALVNAEGTELITLNPVGSLVWNLLDGVRDLDEVVTGIVAECAPVERDLVDRDVRAFLSELVGLGLVTTVP